MPFSAHASACAILAFADGGSRNSSLHPPQEALGISTRRGPGRFFSFPRMLDRRRCFAPAEVIYFNAAAKSAHSARRLSRDWRGEAAPPQAAEFSKVRAAVKPTVSGLPSSGTVRRSAAQCHLPQGEGYALRLPRCARRSEIRALYTAPFAKAGNKKPGGAGLLL